MQMLYSWMIRVFQIASDYTKKVGSTQYFPPLITEDAHSFAVKKHHTISNIPFFKFYIPWLLLSHTCN